MLGSSRTGFSLSDFRWDAAKTKQAKEAAEKGLYSFCHSERTEESLFPFMELNRREILRFARNDNVSYFFRSLFSLSPCKGTEREKPDRLKPVLLDEDFFSCREGFDAVDARGIAYAGTVGNADGALRCDHYFRVDHVFDPIAA